MNTKLIMIIVGVLVLLGAGYWFFMADDEPDAASNGNQDQTASLDRQASLEELAAGRENLVCTYSQTAEDGSTSSGTTYLASGRMSGEFTIAVEGQAPVRSYIINDGQNQYTWQDGSNQGYRFAVDELDADTAADDPVQSVDTGQDYNFNCQEWPVEEARFSPPSNVDFIDFSAQFPQP